MDKLFAGKKVAVVGLGVNNNRLVEFLTLQGVKYSAIDHWHHPDELIDKLDKFDVIFRTPGLPYLSKAIQQAKAKGVEVSSQTKLFFHLCPSPIIGVTGTKGKGTTSSLIAKILENSGRKVWLGGNIGRDPFEFLDQIQNSDLVVLELSSFQLQDLEQSPHIAVVLSISPDHMNHHQNFAEYISAKSNIIKFQKNSDFALLHPSLPDWFKSLGQGQKVLLDPSRYASFKRKLLGLHNLDNIAAAAQAAKLVGVTDEVIQKTIFEFEPLPHRLQALKRVNGITYMDDAYSTNIEPAIAAIEAIDTPIVLIVGGYDKGLDFAKLGEKINSSSVKGLVVIGEVTDKVLQAARGFQGKILTGAKSMTEILDQARSIAVSGDTILFSPATSSFDLFKNETDRGEQFFQAVSKFHE